MVDKARGINEGRDTPAPLGNLCALLGEAGTSHSDAPVLWVRSYLGYRAWLRVACHVQIRGNT